MSLACTLLGLGLILACGGGGVTTDAGPGIVSTLAGGAIPGTTDASGQSARFNNPVSVVIGPDGFLYVADFDNNRIRRIAPGDGSTTTVINQADFVRPFGMAFIGNRLFVQTDGNDQGGLDNTTGTIWEIDITNDTATVVARNLGRPRGIVGLPNGDLAMANLTTHVIETMDPDTGVVSPLAGLANNPGFANGTGTAAQFNRPYGMDLLNNTTLLVADSDNHRIRSVNLTNSAVTTFAGQGTAGNQNGFYLQARFNRPQTVQVLNESNIFVGDNGNFIFRHLSQGSVSIFAGTPGTGGFADGTIDQAEFFGMEGFDVGANGFNFYVADGDNGIGGQPFHRIRKITFEP